MHQNLPSQWSQFFSQLPLPPEWADIYSHSFTENSMQLEMVPDLQPDLMSYLGINKLGHFLMIKKRAKDLLSRHSPSDSLSRYHTDGSSQLHTPYLQSYQDRNYSLSPPLTNTPPNLVPSITMDLESIKSFPSELSTRCHVERKCESFHPIALPPDYTHPATQPESYSRPPDSHTSDNIKLETQFHSDSHPQTSDTTPRNRSSTPIPPTSPHTNYSLAGNVPTSSDVEIDVQPYTETVFTQLQPDRTKPDSGTGWSQYRRARPTVSTQGSVQKKKKSTNRQRKPLNHVLFESTTDPNKPQSESIHTIPEISTPPYPISLQVEDPLGETNPTLTLPCETDARISDSEVSELVSSLSPHNISVPGIMFYHSSEGRNKPIVSRRAVNFLVSIPVRRDPNTGLTTVNAKPRKPSSRKHPSIKTAVDRTIHCAADKVSRAAANPVGDTNAVRNHKSGNLTDGSHEKLSDNSATKFEPVLSLPKLDISHYTLPAEAFPTIHGSTSPQPECCDVESSSIILVDEGADDRMLSLLDVQVVSNQPKYPRVHSPSSPVSGDIYPHTQDIEIVLSDLPSSPDLELTETPDEVELIPSPHSTVESTPTSPSPEIAGELGERESEIQRENTSVTKSRKKEKSARVGKKVRNESKRESHNNWNNIGPEEASTDTLLPVQTGEEGVETYSSIGNVVLSEYQTDNGNSHDEERIITIPSPSHEGNSRDILSGLSGGEQFGEGTNCENTPNPALQPNLGVDNTLCPDQQAISVISDVEDFQPTNSLCEKREGDVLMKRRSSLDSSSKRVKKKSRFLTSKQKLKLSASKGDKMRRRSSRKKLNPGKLSCDEDSLSERVGKVRREKTKCRRKYGSKCRIKSMVSIRPEKKHPSLTVTKYKPIRNSLFETRGRSTSPEVEDEHENGRKFHRTIPRIPKRYNETLSAFYPGLKEEESTIQSVPPHNMSYPRPRPGVRLSLRETVVYARQERRSFSCFKCTSCFETPYQLLQHSMLESCDQFDTRWPEY